LRVLSLGSGKAGRNGLTPVPLVVSASAPLCDGDPHLRVLSLGSGKAGRNGLTPAPPVVLCLSSSRGLASVSRAFPVAYWPWDINSQDNDGRRGLRSHEQTTLTSSPPQTQDHPQCTNEDFDAESSASTGDNRRAAIHSNSAPRPPVLPKLSISPSTSMRSSDQNQGFLMPVSSVASFLMA
jgi:hypothetical protein